MTAGSWLKTGSSIGVDSPHRAIYNPLMSISPEIHISPMVIKGQWDAGYALDFHTVSSDFAGYDEFGHPQYDTKRTELGELLYRLKYREDQSVIEGIVRTVANFVRFRINWPIEVIVPVPPSNKRKVQPVIVLADKLARISGVEYCPNGLTKIKNTPQLKNVYDPIERRKLLAGVFQADPSKIRGKKVLLFDDLFRSGATMNEVSSLLKTSGEASHVYVLAVTRTR
ncbi:MAG: hypothetical protein COV67_11205 [Nitrospinae bacterium CG11_big_fil_rev_8_21_14_0_20_56_8]|nr:MAG: hypothetical protein COV67_11205 [Nitrospinae bacterium CG11_big_fil_rev_8_21_14_0_20_56_8]